MWLGGLARAYTQTFGAPIPDHNTELTVGSLTGTFVSPASMHGGTIVHPQPHRHTVTQRFRPARCGAPKYADSDSSSTRHPRCREISWPTRWRNVSCPHTGPSSVRPPSLTMLPSLASRQPAQACASRTSSCSSALPGHKQPGSLRTSLSKQTVRKPRPLQQYDRLRS